MCEYICDNCGPIEAKTLGDRDTDYCPFCGAGSNEIMPLAEAYRIQTGTVERLTAELEQAKAEIDQLNYEIERPAEVFAYYNPSDSYDIINGGQAHMCGQKIEPFIYPLYAEPIILPKEKLNEWQSAIDSQLVALHLGTSESYESPEKAVKELLDWTSAVAADFAKAAPVAVPDGWALVPVEPTPKMLCAMWEHRDGTLRSENELAEIGYHAMLNAVEGAHHKYAAPEGWQSVAKRAIDHLKFWLSEQLCECEYSHNCGANEVSATIENLESLLNAAPAVDEQWQPIHSAPVSKWILVREHDDVYKARLVVGNIPYWEAACGQPVSNEPAPLEWMPLP